MSRRDKQQEVQTPQYFEDAAGMQRQAIEGSQDPYVVPVPPDEIQHAGYDWRVLWPNGDVIDYTMQELASMANLDVGEVAKALGYKTPADAARLQELADAQSGRLAGRDGGQSSNLIELSIGELNIKDLQFKGDPRLLFGGTQQQSSPLEQAAMAYMANRGQQTSVYQPDAYRTEAPDPVSYWATPVPGTDSENIIDVEAEDEADQESFAPDVPALDEVNNGPPVAPETTQITSAEINAKRKKLLSRISALGIAATISVGGYSVLSVPLGLSEHNLLKADVVGYNMALFRSIFG
ncbi:MAG: hypothetical protein ABIR37_00070 [Candidatus Saccharimonadales bacterium]